MIWRNSIKLTEKHQFNEIRKILFHSDFFFREIDRAKCIDFTKFLSKKCERISEESDIYYMCNDFTQKWFDRFVPFCIVFTEKTLQLKSNFTKYFKSVNKSSNKLSVSRKISISWFHEFFIKTSSELIFEIFILFVCFLPC